MLLRSTLVAVLLAVPVFAQSSGAYWGLEGGVARAWIPQSLIESQDRYTATIDGTAYSAGLVRFHRNGAPNFSFEFSGARLDGAARDLLGFGAHFEAHATVSGFMATKYLNFVARSRFNAGLGFGAGIAPQFQAPYVESATINGQTFTRNGTYTLKEIAVTPLFEVLARADFRVARTLSLGPVFGARSGVLIFGGMVRLHFPK